MIIPDILMAIGSIICSVGLVPALRNKHTCIPRSTSLLTVLGVALILTATIWLELPIASITSSITFLCWWFLVIFRSGKNGEKNNAAKLTNEQVREIKKLLKEGNLSHRQIALSLNVHRASVADISCGRRWLHIQ